MVERTEAGRRHEEIKNKNEPAPGIRSANIMIEGKKQVVVNLRGSERRKNLFTGSGSIADNRHVGGQEIQSDRGSFFISRSSPERAGT
jgi:hypothetical protein